MLARIRKAQENKDSGFTLIELLVVMIIIGILAAIAIPAFLSQKAKARDTSAKADVSTIGKEIALYYVDNAGALALTTSGTAATGVTWALNTSPTAGATPVATGQLSQGNEATSTAITSDTVYCVSVKNSSPNTEAYKYTANGLAKGAC